MRPFAIVVLTPGLDHSRGLGEQAEPVLAQALVPEPADEALHERQVTATRMNRYQRARTAPDGRAFDAFGLSRPGADLPTCTTDSMGHR